MANMKIERIEPKRFMKKKKIKLAIITSRNIATSSGSNNTVVNLLSHLDETKYKIIIILIDDLVPRSLKCSRKDLSADPTYIPFSKIRKNRKVSKIYKLSKLSLHRLKQLFNIAIISIYNYFGEDGRLLGILDTIGIPYLSPSLKTSAACFDKTLTKSILRGNGILVPKGFEVNRKNYNLKEVMLNIVNSLKYPVIVKPSYCGASRGANVANNFSKLKRAIEDAFKFADEVLIEEFLSGSEFSIGVIGHFTEPRALPVAEIVTRRPFFDFYSKYTHGAADEICPAVIDEDLTEKLQKTAIRVYQAVKAESLSRIDMILSSRKIIVLEVNTFPGLTSGSIFPKELNACGLSMNNFLNEAIAQKLEYINEGR